MSDQEMLNEPQPSQESNPLPSKLDEGDVATLEKLLVKVQMTKLSAEKAAAEAETAMAHYNNVVLRCYVKYKMSEEDTIDQSFNIIRK